MENKEVAKFKKFLKSMRSGGEDNGYGIDWLVGNRQKYVLVKREELGAILAELEESRRVIGGVYNQTVN